MLRSITELGLVADLRARPWEYPGPFLPFSCVQVADRLLPLESTLDREFAGRHLVVAIGSNASPDILRRKLERHGVDTTVLHLLARLDGLALGHSAHVSPAGYIPAAAYPDAAATINVVVSALTEDQLRCLDQTEPNYDRIFVATSRLHLSVPIPLPERVCMYRSKWGVITDGTEQPVPFGPQGAIFGRLASWNVLPLPFDGVEHITRALGEREELRARIRDSLSGQETAQ